jgi:catechol 2,3-dioxygenase-like lactoylglutathione lyase family enzyme/quercetin dioxygenase-like cupin family protein
MHLYETHLPVTKTESSKQFYVDIVGLEFAHRDLTRDIIFLWAGRDRRSMLGLWGPGTAFGSELRKCHVAFALSLPELLAAGERLRSKNITCRDFDGEETTEPSVIGWMPSAQLYFTDPDGHSLEFIALLDDPPDPQFIGHLSVWKDAQLKCKNEASSQAKFMSSEEVTVILKRFESPDEVRVLQKGRFELVHLGGMTIGRASYEPGWKWSEHVGPSVGATRCHVEHVGLVLSGTATAAFDDGSVVELRAGELFYIPPLPHDSWVVGDQPYVSLHFVGADHYATR